MKVLLFTHSQDIDGMGCAIIAKYYFENCEVVPTKTFDITRVVAEKIANGNMESYDKIFVTDLCIKEPLLSQINKSWWKEKILVLDHHKSEIDEGNDKYDFVNIVVEKNGIKESGTSLFYQYLINNMGFKRTAILDELVEWTRQYDVYDWVKKKNKNAQKLHILFEMLGYEKYIDIIFEKVKGNQDKIIFNELEEVVVAKYFEELEEDITNILKNMKIVVLKIEGKAYKVGYVKCLYKYRNDINEYVKRENKEDLDMVGMIMSDINTVSYRQIRDVDVSKVATHFGGKGHRTASSNPQSNERFKEMLKEYNIN